MLFRQLAYLVALSRACHASQPALSEAIRKPEDELDVPLVLRGRTYEGLTPEGERIVVGARCRPRRGPSDGGLGGGRALSALPPDRGRAGAPGPRRAVRGGGRCQWAGPRGRCRSVW
ncbi:LysR family transcriptional regulator [Streptomyces sp. NPDC000961]|uniref:LysR family transcriptional regulator n=1 Tax=Streptomyces sp. NPDC000961 TaxID=3364541 RepID=UPI00368BB474